MKYKKSELHGGTLSDSKEDVILAICSKDDIRGYCEERMNIKLSENDIDNVFQHIIRRGPDLIFNYNFWDVIDISINVIRNEEESE